MNDDVVFFRDRREAAERLAWQLARYRAVHPLVLAVPRGAVPMGRILAEALDGDLDVVLVRKLGAPGYRELAIGAVDETGEVALNENARELAVPAAYVEEEARAQLARLAERRRSYTPAGRAIDPAGRVVIVVDDGVATGSTLLAALHAIRRRQPKKLIAAVAVAPPSTLVKLERAADEVVCLASPQRFSAVSQFFADFSEVTDAEVIAILGARRDGAVVAAGRESAVPR